MENNLKHSDLACSIPRRFSLFWGGANTDGASQCPSTGRCWAPRHIQHCVRSLCAIETLALCLGAPWPTGSGVSSPSGEFTLLGEQKIPVASFQQFLGQGWAADAGRAQCHPVHPEVGVSPCPAAVPWCHQSHLLSPFPPRPWRLIPAGIWFCADRALPPSTPSLPSPALSAASEGETRRGGFNNRIVPIYEINF